MARKRKNKPLTVRCSRLPIVAVCPAAKDAPDVGIDTTTDATNAGRATHDLIAKVVRKEPWDIEQTARAYGADLADVSYLIFAARQLWAEVETFFPDPQPEVGLMWRDGDLLLTGTADLMHYDADQRQLRVLDWKSGRLDHSALDQLKGYAILAIETLYPQTETVWLGTMRLRDRVIDGAEFSKREILDWYAQLVDNLESGSYRAGGHCGRCWRSHECPAKTGLMQQVVSSLDMGDITEWQARLPTEPRSRAMVIADVLERGKVLTDALDQFRDMARADVEAHGGTMATGDGRVLEVKEQSRRDLDASKAWPILQGYLRDEQLIPTVDIGLDRLKDAIRAQAPRGEKNKRVEEVFAQLDQSGAVITNHFSKLTIRQEASNGVSSSPTTTATTPAIAATDAAADRKGNHRLADERQAERAVRPNRSRATGSRRKDRGAIAPSV